MKPVMRNNKKALAKVMAAAMMTATVLGNAVPVMAEGMEGVDMSTAYPGITVKAGQTVNFSLDFVSQDGGSYDVALSDITLPENWSGYFKGNNNEITRVHVSGDTMENPANGDGLASYSLDIPAEAQEGTYKVELQADSGSGMKDTLELEVTVNELENGMSDFTTTYAQQQGAAGSSFSFDTTIVNNRGIGEAYALSAEAPAGWQVTFTPSGESANVTALDVDAGTSKGMTVKITPPETVEKGEYTIPCTAISADDTLSTELTVSITGTYDVSLSTSDGRLSFDAYAEKPSKITLTVTNNGNVDLTNLNLTSSAPTGWDVSFSESTIDVLEAGATREITATVTPGKDVITGDYVTAVTIKNGETSSEADFRVSVKTPTTWGYAAAAIIVVLIAVLAGIIKKFGRR